MNVERNVLHTLDFCGCAAEERSLASELEGLVTDDVETKGQGDLSELEKQLITAN